MPLVGRQGRWNEINVLEVQALPDLFGQTQVTVVNGIKGPT